MTREVAKIEVNQNIIFNTFFGAKFSHKVTLSHKVSMVSHKVTLSHKVALSWRALWRSAHGCEPASNRGLWSTTTLARVLNRGVTGVSEVDGKRFIRGRVKLGATAPPQQAREPPTTHNSSEFPLNTRSPSNTRSPQTRDPQPSLLLGFLVPHPPPPSSAPSAPIVSRDISVPTIPSDKGSDLPTNASLSGNARRDLE